MGIFNWLKGGASGPPPDKTTTWIRAQIHEKIIANDARSLAEACATLSNQGSMLFGMILPVTLATRDELREEAVIALRGAVPTMPDSACDEVFATIARLNLPIDVTKRRAELALSRRSANERTAQWLRDQIADKAASGDVVALAGAAVGLSRPAQMAFGMVVPADLLERNELRALALAAIRAKIPTMTGGEVDAVAAIARRGALPLALDERLAETLAERAAERTRAREAAATTEPRNEELEREIAGAFDTDDGDDAYLVYADWLQAQHHPRGELMSMHVRGLHDAAAAHLAAHEATLLGVLAPYRLVQDDSKREAFTWRRGFIDRALFSVSYGGEGSLGAMLEVLLAHPSGRYIRDLTFGTQSDNNDEPLEEVTAILAREAPPTLRSLFLGDFAYPDQVEMSWYLVGNLAAMWPRLAGLRRLIVQGGSFELGDIVLPSLEHAEFRTGSLSATAARSIATATWPKLRSLDIWYGDPNYGADAFMDEVEPLLARTDLALARLGIMNASFTDEVCEGLAGAPIMATVTELDLSMGTLSDAGAAMLVANTARWPNLRVLDVSRNYVSEDAIAQLVAAFPVVVATDQNEDTDPDNRYVTVGE